MKFIIVLALIVLLFSAISAKRSKAKNPCRGLKTPQNCKNHSKCVWKGDEATGQCNLSRY